MDGRMALRKLPFEVQSKFRASAQIRSFKTAIEELVYNALDAKSSSIAIRVNIKENYIQVVDNGHGVAKDDFNILGQRYTSSKYDPSTTFESIRMYGYCGQSLPNLIEISQSVRIISRCPNNVETWMKHFFNGKEEECSIVTERPSVGTTVEIKGFLYNLTIQKKAVKALQELQNIKTFLEQISLIHCNTSISLRDNSENEIIFKVLKNRTVIQTLSSVLSISIANLQEFQVEKNQYKVTGFIQSHTKDAKGYQWIFVNGRFIANSNLHKIVNGNLAKVAPIRNHIKTKYYNNEEETVISNKLPDYYIFIECPKNEYDITSNPKQPILEFKNVIHINKLLEKLVKFYMGDIQIVKVKTTKEPVTTPENKKVRETDTRNKVKQIMQKVLGTQQKKLNGSNLRNGVKGKIMRRTVKKKISSSKSRLTPKEDYVNQKEICEMIDLANTRDHTLTSKHCVDNESLVFFQVPSRKPMKDKRLISSNHQRKHATHDKLPQVKNKIPEKKYNNTNKQPVLLKFEKETDQVHKRCNILANKVDQLLGVKKKRKCKIFTNETIQYNNIMTSNKSISVRKKINEIIIHELVPKLQKAKTVNKCVKTVKDIIKSSDLLCPITKLMKQNDLSKKFTHTKIEQLQPDPNYLCVTHKHDTNILGPTYESHGYFKNSVVPPQHVDEVKKYKKRQFISQDNLTTPIKDKNLNKWQRVTKKLHDNKIKDTVTSSYSIHFTKAESQMNEKRNTEANEADVILFSNNDNVCVGSTYIITESVEPDSRNAKKVSSKTRIIETTGNHDINLDLAGNVNSCSKQLPCVKKTHYETAITVENPNVNVIFISNSQFSKSGSNYFDPLKMCEAIMDSHEERNYDEFIENTFKCDLTSDVIESNIPNGIQTDKYFGPYATRICRKLEDDDFPNIYLHKIENGDSDGNIFKPNDFNLKNRRRYIPKGMSPIFENCNLKNICDYELIEDYFEETVYNNFAHSVQIQSEIFEPRIQNVKETIARDVQRVDIKLNKDNVRRTFNAESLKHAKVLGQVDHKFIASIMNGDCNGAHDCLVLFDQHAVHERIRLEQNLSEYITHNQWKSVSVDGLSLKLNRDEILYLHNYRDKFERLGILCCIVSDTQVMINAIPEAILGKHQRQVDVVLKAVNSLIKEEINIIKEQGGCVSLHPKSIMDLIFSEACRYAIMFGDPLSVRECSELIEALSYCRTPFQCAHGRPALAVLVDVERETRAYTVNFKNIELFRRKQSKLNK